MIYVNNLHCEVTPFILNSQIFQKEFGNYTYTQTKTYMLNTIKSTFYTTLYIKMDFYNALLECKNKSVNKLCTSQKCKFDFFPFGYNWLLPCSAQNCHFGFLTNRSGLYGFCQIHKISVSFF